jgi:hypothetical protein
MTIELGPGRNGDSEPEAVTPGRGGRRVRQVASRKHRMIVLGIELDAVARLLRDRRFQETVIMCIIGLAALARLMRESQERSFARLTAWDKKQRLRRQRRAGARPA